MLQSDGLEGAFDGIGGVQVAPLLRWEIIEVNRRRQSLPEQNGASQCDSEADDRCGELVLGVLNENESVVSQASAA